MPQNTRIKEGKALRTGVTTGSCATGAAKAAATALLSGQTPPTIRIKTPGGEELFLGVEYGTIETDARTCSVQKDAGDDPDVTHGAKIVARVQKAPAGVQITGGKGVGRITKPGLPCPVGEAAINPVPRRMIAKALKEVAAQFSYSGGFLVCISVPKGEELAQKTFNPRLGIVGGISILGTTGIVEPMSEAALIKTIHIEMDNRLACGQKKLLITPGNYGQAFAKKQFGFDLAKGVQCSNYIGETLDYAAFKKVEAVLLIGHAGKLVKIAAGVMNTHSHVADARAEVLAAHAAMAGAKKEQVQAIMACATTDAMQQLLTDWGLDQIVWQSVLQKVMLHLRARTHGELPVETVIFNQDVGILAHSKGAFALAKQIKEEMQ